MLLASLARLLHNPEFMSWVFNSSLRRCRASLLSSSGVKSNVIVSVVVSLIVLSNEGVVCFAVADAEDDEEYRVGRLGCVGCGVLCENILMCCVLLVLMYPWRSRLVVLSYHDTFNACSFCVFSRMSMMVPFGMNPSLSSIARFSLLWGSGSY